MGGQKKPIAFQNNNSTETKIININDLIKNNPIDNWMPRNLILNNTIQKFKPIKTLD